jgi:rhodanese-related sulfurtransferase
LIRKFFDRNILIECVAIIVCAAVTGLTFNSFRSARVPISSLRPVTTGVADSIFFKDIATDTAAMLQQPVVIMKSQLKRLARTQSINILDARTLEEYIVGHIPGALSLPAEELNENENVLNLVPRDKWTICYCDGPPCDLGELLASQLFIKGYPWVAFYVDGLNDWKKTEKIEME